MVRDKRVEDPSFTAVTDWLRSTVTLLRYLSKMWLARLAVVLAKHAFAILGILVTVKFVSWGRLVLGLPDEFIIHTARIQVQQILNVADMAVLVGGLVNTTIHVVKWIKVNP